MTSPFSTTHWLSRRLSWGLGASLVGLLLGIGGMAGGSAGAGLIGYLDQTNDHRFEPWVGQDPSYSEDPMSVLGPPMSPLGLFPGMWQRHHAVDVVSQDTLKKLEAKVAPPRPPGKTAARKGKTLRAAGPWGNRRNVEETYRELFDAPPEATREEDGPPSAAGGLRKLLNPEDDDWDDD